MLKGIRDPRRSEISACCEESSLAFFEIDELFLLRLGSLRS